MNSPTLRIIKNGCWVAALTLLTIAVVVVMAILAGLLVDLSTLTRSGVAAPTRAPGLALPTAALPTVPLGPPAPTEIRFTPATPIQGFSSCEGYGFRGLVEVADDRDLGQTQIVVWEEGSRLMALDTLDPTGHYDLEFAGQPTLRKLWVQVYQNDLPVSTPLPLEIQIDCQSGFQIYQIDWQTTATK